MTTCIVYETGATSHGVNDLILFTDNTRSLAEYRDYIYRLYADKRGNKNPSLKPFLDLWEKAIRQYAKELKDSDFLHSLAEKDKDEYCTLYAANYPNWKREHGYN